VTRRLVVTADDLGRDPATDATVLGLLAAGRVTATTLLVVTPHAAAAAEAATRLGVTPRLHVALTSEGGLPPWSPLSGAPSLHDGGGQLPADPQVLDAHAVETDVLAELDAQLAWMHERGLHPWGVDSHAGTLYGLAGRSWLGPALWWCGSAGLAFRLPRDLRPYLGGPPAPELARRHEAAVALADELGVPLPAAMLTNRRTAAELGDYEALRDHLVAALDDLPDGVSELFLHPAEGLPGEAGRTRAWEARLLRDPAWWDAVSRAGVELVHDWQDAHG